MLIYKISKIKKKHTDHKIQILKKGLESFLVEKIKDFNYDFWFFCYDLKRDFNRDYWCSKFVSKNYKREVLISSCFSVEEFSINRLAFSLNTLKNLKKANIKTTRDLLDKIDLKNVSIIDNIGITEKKKENYFEIQKEIYAQVSELMNFFPLLINLNLR